MICVGPLLSSKLWLGAKVQQQAVLNICRLQIIQQLRFMFWPQRFGGFDFQYHCLLDNNIGKIQAHIFTDIIHLYWHLPSPMQPHSWQLNNHGFFVYIFQKTISQCIVNIVIRSDNLPCNNIYFFLTHNHGPSWKSWKSVSHLTLQSGSHLTLSCSMFFIKMLE